MILRKNQVPADRAERESFGVSDTQRLSAAGGLFLMMATLKAPVNQVAPIQYSQMLWAVFLGYFLFQDTVDGFTWLGIAVILVAGLFTLLREEHITGWWHRQRWLP